MAIQIYLDGVPTAYQRLAREALFRSWTVTLPDRSRPIVFGAPHVDNLRAALLWAVENGQRFASVAVESNGTARGGTRADSPGAVAAPGS